MSSSTPLPREGSLGGAGFRQEIPVAVNLPGSVGQIYSGAHQGLSQSGNGYEKEIRLFTLGDWLKGIYRRWQKEYEQLLSRIAGDPTGKIL